MCRNIKTLFNFAPPATDDEIRAMVGGNAARLVGLDKIENRG